MKRGRNSASAYRETVVGHVIKTKTRKGFQNREGHTHDVEHIKTHQNLLPKPEGLVDPELVTGPIKAQRFTQAVDGRSALDKREIMGIK